jgi:hypothetical protein
MGRTSNVPALDELTFKIVIVINGAQLQGVITDWGGVLTTPILTTVQAWIQTEGIDWDSYRTVMRAWVFDAYGLGASQSAANARVPSSSRSSPPGCSAPTAGS